MYRHCIFCTAALGENQTLEQFPGGAQIAFDPAKGRLWSICLRCGRWNLAPIEERWEAVEEAEQAYRSTSMRAHQENVGIARLPAGTVLVRIGAALPRELAAWRYGTEMQRRRRRHRTVQTLNAISAVALGVWIPSSFAQGRRVVLASREAPLRLAQLDGAKFTRGVDGMRFDAPRRDRWLGSRPRVSVGPGQADAVLGRILTAVNHRGADTVLLEGALTQLARVGSTEGLLRRLDGINAGDEWLLQVRRWQGSWCLVRKGQEDRYEYPDMLTAPLSLAMEMALQEELEREALSGRLDQLRRAWREAEEIAAIADTL